MISYRKKLDVNTIVFKPWNKTRIWMFQNMCLIYFLLISLRRITKNRWRNEPTQPASSVTWARQIQCSSNPETLIPDSQTVNKNADQLYNNVSPSPCFLAWRVDKTNGNVIVLPVFYLESRANKLMQVCCYSFTCRFIICVITVPLTVQHHSSIT